MDGLWLPGKGKFLCRCEQKGTRGHRILPGHPRTFQCVCDIYDIYIYCDTTWNLFKSGRKNPLDTGHLLRVQLTRIHGRWETQRER